MSAGSLPAQPFPAGAFERSGAAAAASAATRFECGICWQVYDPALGDDYGQVPAGTAFADLPAQWTCPGCEAAKHKFMPLPEDG